MRPRVFAADLSLSRCTELETLPLDWLGRLLCLPDSLLPPERALEDLLEDSLAQRRSQHPWIPTDRVSLLGGSLDDGVLLVDWCS